MRFSNFMMDVFKSTQAEFQRIIKDKDLFSMVLLAPILYAFLLSFVYSQGQVTEVPVGAVMKKHSREGQELLRRLDATQAVSLVDQYDSMQAANQAIHQGKIKAWIEVPESYALKSSQGRTSQAWLAANSSNFMLSNPVLMAAADVGLDLSAEKLMYYQMGQGQVRAKAVVSANPILLDMRFVFNPSLNYSSFFVPGLIFAILQQIIIVGFCMSLVIQKEQGVFLPSQKLTWFVGSALPYILLNTAFAFFFIMTIYPLLGLSPQWNQWPLALVLTLLFTTASTLAAGLFSFLFKDRETTLVALMFYSMPAFLISGYSWPQFALPKAVEVVSWLIPITHFGQSIRQVMLNDQVGWQHVQGSVLRLLLFIAVSILVIIYFVRKKIMSKVPK